MIAKKEAPSPLIYEDRYVMAFLDIHPSVQGHALVIPKEHRENLYQMPEGLLARVIKLSKMVAEAQKGALHAKAVNLVNSSGKEAGQYVFHFHMHVIPRFENDELTGHSWWSPQKTSAERLDEISTKLKKVIKYGSAESD
jgi:histidine triad (HIT) family protein